MPPDDIAQPWTIRSTLIAVAELERSVAFYRELGPFDEVAREGAVAVLGHTCVHVRRPDPPRIPGRASHPPWPAVARPPVDHLQRRIARRVGPCRIPPARPWPLRLPSTGCRWRMRTPPGKGSGQHAPGVRLLRRGSHVRIRLLPVHCKSVLFHGCLTDQERSRNGQDGVHGPSPCDGRSRKGHGVTSDAALDVQLRTPVEMGGEVEAQPRAAVRRGLRRLLRGGTRRGRASRASRPRRRLHRVGSEPDHHREPRLQRGRGTRCLSPGNKRSRRAVSIVAAAHEVCPYSNATRGNVEVTLKANGRLVPAATSA